MMQKQCPEVRAYEKMKNRGGCNNPLVRIRLINQSLINLRVGIIRYPFAVGNPSVQALLFRGDYIIR